LAIIWLHFSRNLDAATGLPIVPTFDLQTLLNAHVSADNANVLHVGNVALFTPEQLVFICFALAFVIKIPIVPFHTWLPDLYESCPPGVLVFFAGIVSKLGAYGLIRYGLTLFPGAVANFKWLLAALAVLSIIYGA